jgi:hypothetical protein
LICPCSTGFRDVCDDTRRHTESGKTVILREAPPEALLSLKTLAPTEIFTLGGRILPSDAVPGRCPDGVQREGKILRRELLTGSLQFSASPRLRVRSSPV